MNNINFEAFHSLYYLVQALMLSWYQSEQYKYVVCSAPIADYL